MQYRCEQKYFGPKNIDRDRTRTCNLRIRSPTPYPLGHTVLLYGVKNKQPLAEKLKYPSFKGD